jgi:hypothetical protein
MKKPSPLKAVLLLLFITGFLGIVFSFAYSQGTLPMLDKPVKIMAGDSALRVAKALPAPFVYDFNKDGKKDLIVGQFSEGKVRVYLNVGTNAKPKFNTFSYIQADGKDASVKAN